jgi:hypothetical protein
MSIHYSEHHISGSFHGFFQKLKHMLKPDAIQAPPLHAPLAASQIPVEPLRPCWTVYGARTRRS